MKKSIAALLLGLWSAGALADADLNNRLALEAFMDGAMEMALLEHDVPGATLSVVKDGKVVLAKGYGFADAAQTRVVNPDRTLFRIGSTSKLFTYTGVMQLAEQGLLDLDADVNQYLEGTGVTVPNAFDQPVTLKHILTHRPGLEDGGLGYLFVYQPERIEPFGDSLIRHTPAQVRPPGTQPSYSNWGIAVAGLIVQQVSGMDYNDYVEQNIYAPLGMRNSTFREPLPAALAPDMSKGVARVAGVFQAQGFEYIANFGPAGAMSSTASDMTKFMLAHLQQGRFGDKRILQESTAQLMHSQLATANPALPGMAYGFFEQQYNGHRFIGHGGATGVFHTNMLLSLEENAGIFMSFNGAYGRAAHGAVMAKFMDRYFPGPTVKRLQPPVDFHERAARYAGTYRTLRHSYTQLEKLFLLLGTDMEVTPHASGALVVSDYPGGATYRFVETGDNLFRRVDGEERIAFEPDASGDITWLHVGDIPYRSWYRLAGWETNGAQRALLLTCLLVFVLVLGRSIVRWRNIAALRGTALTRELLPPLMSLCYLVFAIGLVNVLLGNLQNGYPASIYVLLALPLIGVLLTAAGVFYTARAWLSSAGSLASRLQITFVMLISVVFLLELYYWNALGWQV